MHTKNIISFAADRVTKLIFCPLDVFCHTCLHVSGDKMICLTKVELLTVLLGFLKGVFQTAYLFSQNYTKASFSLRILNLGII